MEDLSPEHLLKYWRKGKPIYDAIWAYCDQYLIEQYEQIQLPQDSSYHDYNMQKVAAGLFNLSQYPSKKRSALNDLYRDLSEKISSGQLIAIGFKSPPDSNFPILIPYHMWPPEKVDFDKSGISSSNIEFIRVRILKKPRTKRKGTKSQTEGKKEIALPETEIHDKTVGRPSLRPKIMEAYEFLKERGKIDYSKKLISHIKLIQDTVRALHPEIEDNKGMQYEVIRRTIGKQYETDQKSSK